MALERIKRICGTRGPPTAIVNPSINNPPTLSLFESMKFCDLSDLQLQFAFACYPVGMKIVLLLLIAWSAMQSDHFFNDGKSPFVINDAFPY